MSNGYGYKTQVSPAQMGPVHGYGYGGAYPYPMGGGMQQPMAMPMTLPATMQAQAMPMAMPPAVPSGAFVTPAGGTIVTAPTLEESYIENILRLNRGKLATFYMTYENNREWNAKIFKGVIEAAGRDHIIISDPKTGMRFLLLTLNLDYVTFDEPIAYEYPFQGSTVTSTTPMGTATIGTAR